MLESEAPSSEVMASAAVIMATTASALLPRNGIMMMVVALQTPQIPATSFLPHLHTTAWSEGAKCQKTGTRQHQE